MFQYIDDNGQRYTVESDDVNNYLREITGQDFTAKDFRTWSGTVFAAEALQGLGKFETQTQARKNVGQAIEVAAGHLGNTKAICRKCYVHPQVIDAYLNGSLLTRLSQYQEQDTKGWHPEEARVLEFLKESMAEEIQ